MDVPAYIETTDIIRTNWRTGLPAKLLQSRQEKKLAERYNACIEFVEP
jgi:hypothetical protein